MTSQEEHVRIERDKDILGGLNIISRKSDGYINATRLCLESGKLLSEWKELVETNEFIKELSKTVSSELILEDNEDSTTWLEPVLAVNLMLWISPCFTAKVSKWNHLLLSTGSVQIPNGVSGFTQHTEMDAEAADIELTEFGGLRNKPVIYIAYIGEGLVKVGFFNWFQARNIKRHTSGIPYEQWRVLKCIRVSEKPVKKILYDMLGRYRTGYGQQRGVYKPTRTLTEFVIMVEQYLKVNDLKMIIQNLEQEVLALKNDILELRLVN